MALNISCFKSKRAYNIFVETLCYNSVTEIRVTSRSYEFLTNFELIEYLINFKNY